MAKIVITGGCSFTAGVELEDYKDNWEKGLEESKLVWSYRIKEMLWPAAEFFNAGKSGASNATIARKTLFYVNEALTKYSPSDIVVLIMWTGVDRREWRLPKNSNLTYDMSDLNYENTTAGDAALLKDSDILQVAKKFYHPVWTNFRKQALKEKRLDKIVLNYYKQLINKNSSLYDALKHIEYLTMFLDKNNIKYYYTTSDRHILDYSKDAIGDDMFLDRLIKEVDPVKNFFSINEAGFTEFASNYPFCEFGHPDKEAHLMFARAMSKWIKLQQDV